MLNDLTERNIIYNKNKNDPEKESFKLFNDDGIREETSTQTDFEEEEVNTNVEDYINESFNTMLSDMIKKEVKCYVTENLYETLVDVIKGEVKNELREKSKECDMQNGSFTTECHKCEDNLLLTSALRDNIDFLQEQLQSKDVIIKMLIEDRKNLTPSKNNLQEISIEANNCSKQKKLVQMDERINNTEIARNEEKVIVTSNEVQKMNVRCNETMEHVHGHRLDEHESSQKEIRRNTSNERNIAILGDSMIKEVDPFELKKKLNNKKNKVYRHSFTGATISAMKHHAVPVMEFEPDLAILHVGSNNLRSNTSEQQIASDIVNLATSLKTDNNKILVSSIIARRDQFKNKAEKVNDYLHVKCSQANLPFLRHNNIRSEIHLKPKGVHLNNTGTTLLSDNFAAYINS